MINPSVVESVFLAALERATTESRSAFLDDACKDDPDLREHVSRLLAAHPKAAAFLEQPAIPVGEKTAVYVPSGEQPGGIVAGRYKVLEVIGEGGMGQVWVADQLEPIRRRVALKLIKLGMDSRSVLARFEAERQALAIMDHPNIAKVFDAGSTPEGRPYFAMELVKGIPITEFCDARKLSARERLELFVPVCQAIQHAHTKGIIHRDIKPSNVLVALHDERPVAKVIDFGVSKAVGQQLTEKTIYTGFGALVGTPAYMAPEQATFNQLDIDTRADVYALGVLLYELLVGSPPVEPERMKRAALDEVLRLVREEEPPRPSQRLSTSQSRASIAAVRQTDPIRLSKLIQGELDWIVMKALEKDRNRRYETANGFAADVECYLAGEQVQAVPPSVAYRLRKFASKNRSLLTSAIIFAAMLIGAAGISTWLAIQARQAEATAKEKEAEARDESMRADRNAATLAGALTAADETRRELEIMAAGLKVDGNLAMRSSDSGEVLLHLCRTLLEMPTVPIVRKVKTDFLSFDLTDEVRDARMRELRGFVTAAVLAKGQAFSPLLPPISHDGAGVIDWNISSTGDRLLTLGADSTARLWDVRTTKQIATLRKGTEQVLRCGLSPDGKTAFTDAPDGIVRLWGTTDGRYRTETQPRAAHVCTESTTNYAGVDGTTLQTADLTQIHNARLITRSVGKGFPEHLHITGPVDLWDTRTGRLIAHYDDDSVPGLVNFRISHDGRWILAHEGVSVILVFSADDGRQVGRLSHADGESVDSVDTSPSGNQIATSIRNVAGKHLVRLWDANSCQAKGETTPVESSRELRFWTEDTFTTKGDSGLWSVQRFGESKPIGQFSGMTRPSLVDGLVQIDGTQVHDLRTWECQRPEPGNRFHPDLIRFAPDRRFTFVGFFPFVGLEDCEFIDTRTEKAFHVRSWHWNTPPQYLSGFGFVWASKPNSETVELQLLPTLDQFDLPPKLLELWTQVVVRGELGDDGRFVEWPERTWEIKRQELAATSAPRQDLPFPGYVATDKLHWLRAKYFAAQQDGDKQQLARELLRRADENGDSSELLRWRAVLASLAPMVPSDSK